MPVKYRVNGKDYTIPDNVVSDFENDNPDARVLYTVNEKNYAIPLEKREAFLKRYPDAVSGKAETPTAKQDDTQGSALKPAPTMEELRGEKSTPKYYKQAYEAAHAEPRPGLREMVNPTEPMFAPLNELPVFNPTVAKNGMLSTDDLGQRLKKVLKEGGMESFAHLEEDAEVDALYTPKKVESERDILENYQNRFKLTERGAQLDNERAEIERDIVDKYYNEFQQSDEYKKIANGHYETEAEVAEANKALNDLFLRNYGEAIGREMAPYEEAFNSEMLNRYGSRVNEELSDLAKKNNKDAVKDLSAELDNMLAVNDEAIRSNNSITSHYMRSWGGQGETGAFLDERRTLNQAKKLLEESQNIIDEAGKKGNTNFVSGLARGFWDNLDAENFTFGLAEVADMKALYTALDKAEKGEELTASEEKLLEASTINMATQAYYGSDLGRGYKAGQTTAVSLPFMLSFIANPISGSGNALAKGLLKYGLKRFGHVAATKGAKFAGRLIGDAGAALGMMGTTELPRVVSGAYEQMARNYDYNIDESGNLNVEKVGDTNFGKALGKSATKTFFELQSEMVFNAFKGAAPMLKAAEQTTPGGLNGVMDMIKNSRAGQLYRQWANNPTMREIAQRAQFHGIGEEYLEEVYNNFANIPFGDMTAEEALDLDNNIDTFLGLAPTSAAFAALGLGSMAYERADAAYRKKRIAGILNEEQQQKLAELEKLSKEKGNEDIKLFIKETIAATNLTPEEKAAEIEYAYQLAREQAINDVGNEQVAEREQSGTEQGAAIYASGDRTAMRNAVLRREVSRERLQDYMSDDDVSALENADEATRTTILESLEPEARRRAEDYLEQRAVQSGLESALDEAHRPEVEAARQIISTIPNSNKGITLVPLGDIADDTHTYGVLLAASPNSRAIVSPIEDVDGRPDLGTFDITNTTTAAIPQEGVITMTRNQALENMLTGYEADAAFLEDQPLVPGQRIVLNNDAGESLEYTLVGQIADGNWRVTDSNNQPLDISPEEVIAGAKAAEKTAILEEYRLQDEANEGEKMRRFSPEVRNLQPQAGEKVVIGGREGEITGEADGGLVVTYHNEAGDIIGIEPLSLDDYYEYKQSLLDADKKARKAIEKAATTPVEGEQKESEEPKEDVISSEVSALMKQLRDMKLDENSLANHVAYLIAEADRMVREVSASAPINAPESEREAAMKAHSEKVGAAIKLHKDLLEARRRLELPEREPIPTNRQGRPLYHLAPVDDVLRHLAEERLEDEELDAFIAAQQKEASDNLAKLTAKAPKMGTDIPKYKAEKAIWQKQVDEVEKRRAFWNEVEVALKKARKPVGQDKAEEILQLDDAMTGEELAAKLLAQGRLPLLQSSYMEETGYGRGEVSAMFGLFRSADNGGMTVDHAAELLALADEEEHNGRFFGGDSEVARNTLLSVLSEVRTTGGLNNYIKAIRAAQAQREQEAEYAAYERTINEMYGVSVEEYEAREEQIAAYLAGLPITQEQYTEFINTFADEFNRIDNERASERNAAASTGSSEVLYSEQSDNEAGVRGTEEGSEETDGSSVKQNGTASAEEQPEAINEPIAVEVPEVTDDNAAPVITEEQPTTAEVIEAAEAEVNTEPTEAQKKAGNYKMGHVKLFGFDVTIENPKGSERKGVDASGKPWSVTMNNTYGYIRGTEGVDGDHIDVFLSDHTDNWNGQIFVIDQVNSDGSFDEHKVMIGFNSLDEARENYLKNYSEGWTGLGSITEVGLEEFRKWVDSSHRKTKAFAEYKSVRLDASVSAEQTENESELDVLVNELAAEERERNAAFDAYVAAQSEQGEDSAAAKENYEKWLRTNTAEKRAAEHVSALSDEELEDALSQYKNTKLGEIINDEINRRFSDARREQLYQDTAANQGELPQPGKTSPYTIQNYTSKDEQKPALGGVHHDNGLAIASDGFVMVGDAKAYDKQKDGKTFDKKGNEIDVPYPNWKAVRDVHEKNQRTAIPVDWADMRNKLLSMVEAVRAQWQAAKDGGAKTSFNDYMNTAVVLLRDKDGGVLGAKLSYLVKFVQASEAIGAKAIEIGALNNALMSHGENGSFALLMPVDVVNMPGYSSVFVYEGLGEQKSEPVLNDETSISKVEPTIPASPTQEKYDDFGEKIGAARKDTAARGFKRGEGESMPAWKKKYKLRNVDEAAGSKVESVGNGYYMKAPAFVSGEFDANKPFVVVWEAKRNGRTVNKYVRTSYQEGYQVKVFNSMEEYEAFIPVFELSQQNYRIMEKEGKYVIYRLASNNKRVEYAVFDTKEEATAYMNSPEGATSLLNKKRENFELPALEKLTRTIPDYRQGKDVTPDMLMETFGFRGGEFGNWLNAAERQQFLNYAYDALLDLSHLLGVSPRALSLGGELSIAFGARGKQGAAAHYEPGRAVINLTKMNGAGSLAHEWAHALDNYFGLMLTGKQRSRENLEQNREMITEGGYGRGVREEVRKAFSELMRAIKSKVVDRTVAVDEAQADVDKMAEHVRGVYARERERLQRGVRRREYNRKTKKYEDVTYALSEAELTELDGLVEKLLNGEFGWEYDFKKAGYRATGATADRMYELIKKIESNTKGTYGPLHNLFYYADKLKPLKARLEKAKSGEKETARVDTDVYTDSKWFDKGRVSPYFSKEVELFARAFEAYLVRRMADTGDYSDYLTYEKGSIYQSMWDHNPYPAGEELTEISKLFDNLFSAMQEKVENGKTILFQVTDEGMQNDTAASQLATAAVMEALHGADINVVEATDEQVDAVLGVVDGSAIEAELQIVEDVFDKQIDSFNENNADETVFMLGRPSALLLAGGVVNNPIKLYGSKLLKKMRKHGFEASELKGLPRALANPIAVFNNYQSDDNRSVLTELKTKNGNILVAINIGKGNDIDFDIISTVFGKEGNSIIKWINKGYLTSVDKQKALDYLHLSAPIAEASNSQELNDAAKVIKDFENPSIEAQIVYHGSGAAFDRFDHRYMSTGEGAQAFGWGTYVTQVEGIARGYAEPTVNKLFKSGFGDFYIRKLREGMAAGKSFEEVKQELLDHHRYLYEKTGGNTEMYGDFISDYRKLMSLKEEELPLRNLYEVEIPENDGKNYLSWYDEPTEADKKRIVDGFKQSDIYKDFVSRFGEALSNMYIKQIEKAERGEQVYMALVSHNASENAPREASEFLSSIGYVGIEYPTNSLSGGNTDGTKNYAIFNEADLQIQSRVEFLREGSKVYGWTDGSTIYLTKAGMNPNTPIHEYTHLWARAMMQKNPQGWDSVKSLMKGTPVWNEVMADENYASIREDEDAVVSEALSRISGSVNATKMEQMAQQLLDEAGNNVLSNAKARDLINRMKRALQRFWNWVGVNLFGIEKFESVEQVTDRVLYDLVNQTDLGEIEGGYVETQIVDDPKLIEKLESGEKVTGFRNVVQNPDGSFGSPMASKLGNKGKQSKKTTGFELNKWEQAEENLDIVNENGKVNLIKPDGKSVDQVDYNPYIHNRLDMVNAQFKQAWERPNLVYVETEVPKSELDNPYHAERAALPTGVHKWNGGDLMLSRYDKPIRVVPWEEVADDWVKRFAERGVEFDIVPPALLPILAERGVAILPPHKGMGQNCIDAYNEWKERANEPMKSEEQQIADEATNDIRYRQAPTWKSGDVVGVTETFDGFVASEGLSGEYPSKERLLDAFRNKYPQYFAELDEAGNIVLQKWSEMFSSKAPAKGKPLTKKQQRAVAYAEREANRRIARVEAMAEQLGIKINIVTDLKEVKGRKAKRAKGWYDVQSGEITILMPNHASMDDVMRTVLHEAVAHHGLRKLFGEQFDTFLDNVFEALPAAIQSEIIRDMAESDMSRREAVEEYLARLAEDTNFENAVNEGWFEKVKQLFLKMLAKVGFRMSYGETLTDNDLRYILWRSYDNLLHPGLRNPLDFARDLVKQQQLSVNGYETASTQPAVASETVVSESATPYSKYRAIQDKVREFKAKNKGTGEVYIVNKDNIQNISVIVKGLTWSKIMQYKHEIEQGSNGIYDEDLDIILIFEDNAEIEKIYSYLWHETSHRAMNNLPDGAELTEVLADLVDKQRPNARETLSKEYDESFLENELAAYFMGDIIKKLGSGKEFSDEFLASDANKAFTKIINYIVYGEEGNPTDGTDPIETIRFFHVEGTDRAGGRERVPGNDSDNTLRDRTSEVEHRPRKTEGPGEGTTESNRRYRVGERRTDRYPRHRIVESYDERVSSNRFNFQEAFQDSMLSLKILMDEVVNYSGKPVQSFEDAYTAENRMSSLNKQEAEKYMRDFFEPLLAEIKSLTDEFGETEVERYIYAKSGLERNEVFVKRDADAAYDKDLREIEKKWNRGDIDASERALLTAEAESERRKALKEKHDYSGLREWAYIGSEEYEELEDKFRDIEDREKNHKISPDEADKLRKPLLERKEKIESQYQQKAEEAVAAFEAKVGMTRIGELWKKINAATNETLRKDYASGMLSKEQYEELKEMMKYYVPMRGWDTPIAENVYKYSHKEAPITSNQKKAEGRSTVSYNPIANIAAAAQNAIVRGNRNKMKQRLFNFVVNRPNPLVTVGNVWYVRQPDGRWQEQDLQIPANSSSEEIKQLIEEHEERMKEMEKAGNAFRGKKPVGLELVMKTGQSSEHAIPVMINGEEYLIYVNADPRAAQAVNGQTNSATEENVFWSYYDAIKRYYGGSLTSNNPDFVIANFVRDSIHSSTMTFMDKGAVEAARFMLNVPKAAKYVLRGVLNKDAATSDDPIDVYFREFVEHGGETGYTAVHTVEDWKREYDRYIKEVGGIEALKKKGTNAIKEVAAMLEIANRIAEDVNRFNAYLSCRQSGLGIEESINAAKNITVNFNKKGSLGKGRGAWSAVAWFMNKWILFFNPTVQGVYQIGRSIKNNKKRAAATLGTVFASGFLMPFFNELLVEAFCGDDDEKRRRASYWNQTDYNRMNNWMIYNPFTNGYIRIPLPPTFRELYGMGDILYRALTGRLTAGKAAYLSLRQLQAATGAINILPSDEPKMYEVAGGLAPDILAPMFDVAFNRDFSGRKIAKTEEYNKYLPEYERIYKGVNPFYVGLSKLLNEIGGSDAERNPYFGEFINPAFMQHIVTGYTGGIGKTITNITGAAWDFATGNTDNIEFRQAPVVNRFYTPVTDRTYQTAVNREYRELLDEYSRTSTAIKRMEQFIEEGENVVEWIEELDRRELNGEVDYVKYIKDREKELKKLTDRQKEDPNNKELANEIADFKAETIMGAKEILENAE